MFKKLDFSGHLALLSRKEIAVERLPYNRNIIFNNVNDYLGISLLKTHFLKYLGFDLIFISQLFSTFVTSQLVVSNYCLGM